MINVENYFGLDRQAAVVWNMNHNHSSKAEAIAYIYSQKDEKDLRSPFGDAEDDFRTLGGRHFVLGANFPVYSERELNYFAALGIRNLLLVDRPEEEHVSWDL